MTTQTKWTPGTWFLNGPWNIYAEREGERSKCVATIVPQGTIAEREANARLIAAAPELADFVRAYLETASSPSGLGKIVEDDGVSGHAEIADIDAKARALLARLGAV